MSDERRRIILNLAMSLDGYIADKDGGYGWIPEPEESGVWDYGRFLEGIDTVVMGRRCYEQGMAGEFPDKEVLVAGSGKPEGNIHFLDRDAADRVAALRQRPGRDIYLFGGGLLARDFIARDLVDEYIIGVIPVILGEGIPLFYSHPGAIALELKETIVTGGTVILRYVRKSEKRVDSK